MVDLSQFENISQEISDRGKKWLNLMLNSQYMDPYNLLEEYRDDAIFEKVFEELRKMVETEEDVKMYNVRRDARDSYAAMMIDLEEFVEKKGIQKGERNKAIEIAKIMKSMKHITRRDIVGATGLTEEEIDKL